MPYEFGEVLLVRFPFSTQAAFLVSLLLCAAGMFSVGRWLFPTKRRRSQSAVPVGPVQRGHFLETGHKLLINKQGALPSGFDREFQAGLYPLSQVIAAAFETLPNSAGFYAVTFSPKTLEALRTGQAHLMHGVGGDRAIAVELNGKKIMGIGTVAEPGFDALRACFATASLLTGQYFLARIDTKLNAIFSGVQDMLRTLDSAERAKLNLATTYLKCLIHQGRCFDQDEVEIRSYRMECLLIAESNIIELEDRMAHSSPREAFGVKERFGELMESTTTWVSKKASIWQPSVKERMPC